MRTGQNYTGTFIILLADGVLAARFRYAWSSRSTLSGRKQGWHGSARRTSTLQRGLFRSAWRGVMQIRLGRADRFRGALAAPRYLHGSGQTGRDDEESREKKKEKSLGAWKEGKSVCLEHKQSTTQSTSISE